MSLIPTIGFSVWNAKLPSPVNDSLRKNSYTAFPGDPEDLQRHSLAAPSGAKTPLARFDLDLAQFRTENRFTFFLELLWPREQSP
ncbi:hypothetical protein [Mesorhizobium loti]|uniref:hypothetical protein n=1 Tax=Rhizobium loti TaxID=381 RepID=UPI000D6CBE73|nr:hypothetical protein [Mesorhizobium loti]